MTHASGVSLSATPAKSHNEQSLQDCHFVQLLMDINYKKFRAELVPMQIYICHVV